MQHENRHSTNFSHLFQMFDFFLFPFPVCFHFIASSFKFEKVVESVFPSDLSLEERFVRRPQRAIGTEYWVVM